MDASLHHQPVICALLQFFRRALELLRAQIRLQESDQLRSAAARAGTGAGASHSKAGRGGDSRGWGAAERAYDALISGDRSAASRHAVVHPMMRNIADGVAQVRGLAAGFVCVTCACDWPVDLQRV